MSSEISDTIYLKNARMVQPHVEGPLLFWVLIEVFGVTIGQISEALDMSRVQVSRYKRGKRQLPKKRYPTLLELLRHAAVGVRLSLALAENTRRKSSGTGDWIDPVVAILEAKMEIANRVFAEIQGYELEEDEEYEALWKAEAKRLQTYPSNPHSHRVYERLVHRFDQLERKDERSQSKH